MTVHSRLVFATGLAVAGLWAVCWHAGGVALPPWAGGVGIAPTPQRAVTGTRASGPITVARVAPAPDASDPSHQRSREAPAASGAVAGMDASRHTSSVPRRRIVINLVFPYHVPKITYEIGPAPQPPGTLVWVSCPDMTPCLTISCSHMLLPCPPY